MAISSAFLAVLYRFLDSRPLLRLEVVLMWLLCIGERSIAVSVRLSLAFPVRTTLLSLFIGIWILKKFA